MCGNIAIVGKTEVKLILFQGRAHLKCARQFRCWKKNRTISCLWLWPYGFLTLYRANKYRRKNVFLWGYLLNATDAPSVAQDGASCAKESVMIGRKKSVMIGFWNIVNAAKLGIHKVISYFMFLIEAHRKKLRTIWY